jgi:hypothetical protein
MASRSVEDVAAKLYAIEPPAFVAARSEAARETREAGNRELATAIGKLRRPVVAAWAVNLLARHDAAGLGRLLALGTDLREAHQQMRGEALQRLADSGMTCSPRWLGGPGSWPRTRAIRLGPRLPSRWCRPRRRAR